MSGILDKKSRIIDFVITENGRSQMQSGDIRYRYATLSDKSIIYSKDKALSESKKADVSDSEIQYIPLETSTSLNNLINPEFDLNNYFLNNNNNTIEITNSQNSNDSDTSINTYLSNFSTGNYLKNLKYLTSKSSLNSSKSLKFIENNYLNNSLDFTSSASSYETIKEENVSKKKIPIIALDKRLSHKNNFLFLPPVTSQEVDLYSKDAFKNLEDLDEENTAGFLFSSYNKKFKNSEEILSREKEILKVINSLEKNDKILKRIYDIEDNTEFNSFLFELFEVKSSVKIEKLSFIKIGDFYDRKTLSTKKVYLIGKIIDTRDKENDLDVLFNFNNGNINLNNQNKVFAISAYFSFVNLFTLVIE